METYQHKKNLLSPCATLGPHTSQTSLILLTLTLSGLKVPPPLPCRSLTESNLLTCATFAQCRRELAGLISATPSSVKLEY